MTSGKPLFHTIALNGLPTISLAAPDVDLLLDRAVAPDLWQQAQDSTYVCHSRPLAFRASVRERTRQQTGAHCELQFSVQATEPCRVRRCAAVFEIPSVVQQPRVLDRNFVWKPLTGVVAIPDYSPLVVQFVVADGQQAFELRHARGFVPCRLSWQNHVLRVEVVLDAACLHPRWRYDSLDPPASHAAPHWAHGEEISVALQIHETGERFKTSPAVLSRYPSGYQAAVTFSHHCDYDDKARLKVLLHGHDANRRGWLGRGLRWTFGVFSVASNPPGGTRVPTLEDAEFVALIDSLHREGSEIVPHALSEWSLGERNAAIFPSTVAEFCRRWQPRTWIDHGCTILYTYNMGGAERSEFRLLEQLQPRGVRYLWSYHDSRSDANQSLNMLNPLPRQLWRQCGYALRAMVGGRPLVSLYYLRDLLYGDSEGKFFFQLRKLASEARQFVMRRRKGVPASTAPVQQVVIDRRFRHEYKYPHTMEPALCPVFFPESGKPLHQVRAGDFVMFTSQPVNNVHDAYTPRNLDRLISEHGLHLGHDYILNVLPYVAGAFKAQSATPELTPQWLAFTDSLEQKVGQHVLWNPTVGELGDFMVSMQEVGMYCRDQEVVVCNYGDSEKSGITVLLPGRPHGTIQWGDGIPDGRCEWGEWTAVWGKLPMKSETCIRFQ